MIQILINDSQRHKNMCVSSLGVFIFIFFLFVGVKKLFRCSCEDGMYSEFELSGGGSRRNEIKD